MPKPFSEEKRQEWQRLVEQCQSDDRKVSITRWCSERNIDYHQFLYWKERFGSGGARKVTRSSFQELIAPTATTGITLEYLQVRIQLEEQFNVTTLKQCLKALKEALC